MHREFVALPDEQLPRGYLYSRPDLTALALEPPPDRLINATTVADAVRASAGLHLEPVRPLADCGGGRTARGPGRGRRSVVAVESGGKCFAEDGRMIIRFENHLFYRHWGAANPQRFEQHFRLDADTPWLGHRWRPSADEEFREQHQWHGQPGREPARRVGDLHVCRRPRSAGGAAVHQHGRTADSGLQLLRHRL